MRELPLFKQNEKAIIHSTPNWEFEDTECTIVGLSAEFAGNNSFYIIQLCRPSADGWTHSVLTNACLNKIN